MPGIPETMHEFGQGTLHSGSKDGPVVTNPKQAEAIALSQAGQSDAKKVHPRRRRRKRNRGSKVATPSAPVDLAKVRARFQHFRTQGGTP